MSDNEINFLGDMQRLETKPGDRFVIQTDKSLSNDACLRIHAAFNEFLPGAKLIILTDGLKLGLVGTE